MSAGIHCALSFTSHRYKLLVVDFWGGGAVHCVHARCACKTWYMQVSRCAELWLVTWVFVLRWVQLRDHLARRVHGEAFQTQRIASTMWDPLKGRADMVMGICRCQRGSQGWSQLERSLRAGLLLLSKKRLCRVREPCAGPWTFLHSSLLLPHYYVIP